MFSGGARTLSHSRCSCRPTPGARVLVVFYPAFRADALHAGLLADTRSAGSVSLCAAKHISPTREAVARSAEAPGEVHSAAPAADDKAFTPSVPCKGRRALPEPALCGAQSLPNERLSFVPVCSGINDIQACGLNDIFAVGKNDIALWATIFTLRVNGEGGHFPMNASLLFMAAAGITIFKPAA